MKIAHTPGPWFVGNADVEAMRWDVYSPWPNGGAADIAHVLYDHAAAPDQQIGLANARLISASPELLAAAKGFLDVWDASRTTCEQVALELRNAVAAAEGRS